MVDGYDKVASTFSVGFKTADEFLVIGPREGGSKGDINGDESCVAVGDKYSTDLLDTTLQSLLKERRGRALAERVLNEYGLNTGDLERMISSTDSDERRVLSYVADLSAQTKSSRERAIKKLIEKGNDIAFRALSARGIYDLDPKLRLLALEGLVKIDAERALPFIAAVRENDPSDRVKFEADEIFAETLSKLGKHQAEIEAAKYKRVYTVWDLRQVNRRRVRIGIDHGEIMKRMTETAKEQIF